MVRKPKPPNFQRAFWLTLGAVLLVILLGMCVAQIFAFPIHPPKFRTRVPTENVSHELNNSLDITYIEQNLVNLAQNNPQLIRYARVRYLTPPSTLPYPFKGSFKDAFSDWVAKFFKNKRNGIFIEAGANDMGSHTLYLEKHLGWTGLLIECNPTVLPYLKSRHRKAWVASVCLAPTSHPGIVNFSNPVSWSPSGTFRKPWGLNGKRTNWTFFEVETVPLYTLLAALGLNEVDYFSFDIEGAELSVLRTFPFDLVKFKVLIVETFFYNQTEKNELDLLLKANGYIPVHKFLDRWKMDRIYVHNSANKHLLLSIAV